MPSRQLTINLRDFRDTDLADQEIVISLAQGDRAVPDAPEPGRLVASSPISVWTNHDGLATIDLIPTTDLVGRHSYSAAVPGVGTIVFQMPDAASSLYDILTSGSPSLPARQLPDPNAVPDGDTIVSLNNVWQAGRFVSYGTTQPQNPVSGQAAIWWDSSSSPPTLRYWNGTAWVAFALQPDAAGSAHIRDGSVGTAELADGSVTEPKMADNAASSRVLAARAVTTSKLAGQAVDAASIAPGAIVEAAIRNQAVTRLKLANDAVGPDQLADNAVDTNAIQNLAVTEDKLAAGIVSGHHIVAGEVGTTELEDRAVTEPKLADDAVSTRTIADNAVGSDQIATGAVRTNELANLSVTNQKLVGSAVDFRNLAADSVRTAAIQAGAVTRGEIHADVLDLLLPTGGSRGQVLTKSSAVDGDADWQAAAGGEDAATWAEQGNNDLIPVAKIPDIPAAKLPASSPASIYEGTYDNDTSRFVRPG